MDQQKGQVSNLLENTWFFGNTLNNKSKPPKIIMVRSNSDPCSSSTTMEKTLVSQDLHHNPLKMSNTLHRAPSLPTFLGKDEKHEHLEEEEDDYEPRMSDLIRQAMPIQVSSPKLDRMSSLPSCRAPNNEVSSVVSSNVNKGGKLSRKVSVESSALLQEKSTPVAIAKLTRRASMEPSLLLPPKYASKGAKQSPSNSKNRPLKKQDPSNKDSPTKFDQSKIQTITKSKSHKSLSDLESEELQGFKDLGFSFSNDVSPNVTQLTQVLPSRLQRGASLDSKKVRRPYVSEAWQKPSSPLSVPPSDSKSGSPKAELSQNMKAQIKFWARAVASNVRQEC